MPDQCQCIKSDLQKCSRQASKVDGTNPNYCWQHQLSPLDLHASRRLTQLSGPISFYLYPNIHGKKILLIGEQHHLKNLCPSSNQCLQTTKCVSYDIDNWLYDLAIASPECLDILIEQDYVVSPVELNKIVNQKGGRLLDYGYPLGDN